MPIRNYPFTTISSDKSLPMLWIRIFNSHGNSASDLLAIDTLAIIDTGADDCAFPAPFAVLLGHDLESVPPKPIITAGGTTTAYPHTSRIDIYDMKPSTKGAKVLYTIPDTPIDFTIGCEAFLLGRKNFLNRFVLTIDYPQQLFSVRFPQVQQRKKKKKPIRR